MAKKETIPTIIDTPEALTAKIAAMKEAQKIFATYTQEQVDKIFKAAATAADKMRIPLAKMAVEETGMGIMEDKVIKNHYAAEYVYNAYKNTQTCGVVEEDKAYGIKKILEPIGLVAAVIPTTNPTSTALFKSLISLKTRTSTCEEIHHRSSEGRSRSSCCCRRTRGNHRLDRCSKPGADQHGYAEFRYHSCYRWSWNG